MPAQVVAVIGAGGIGQAIARRQGAGRTVLLADRNEAVLAAAKDALEAGGHTVVARQVDVSSREPVRDLAQAAAPTRASSPAPTCSSTAASSPPCAPAAGT